MCTLRGARGREGDAMPIIRLDNLQPFQAVNVLLDPGAIGGKIKIPSCAQVTVNWTLPDAKQAHNVLYGRYSGTLNPTQAMVNAMFSALGSGAGWTGFAGGIATTVSLLSVSIRDVNDIDLPMITSNVAALPGTGIGSSLPSEVAVCITFRTAKAGQSGRGRMYTPPMVVGAGAAGDIIASNIVTGINNWASANIPAMMSAGGMVHVLGLQERAAYTGSTGTQHPARAATSQPVTSYIVRDNHWDSQRRRGLK